ncbi:MAG TPA: type 1 glutamine amidotransferase domain-containing protein [Candidatus Saccharimonadales bacterium]
MSDLSGKHVAMIVDNYVEEAELVEPKQALEEAGATVDIIAPQGGNVQTMQNDVEMASIQPVDHTFDEIDLDNYDAMVVPGGAVNADHLRTVPEAREAIATFLESGRPLAMICHAPWALISAGAAGGKKLTSFFTLKDDLQNAGAEWIDQDVVIDDNLITSRNPDDIPAFNNALISMMA